jgi:hypothetical protein
MPAACVNSWFPLRCARPRSMKLRHVRRPGHMGSAVLSVKHSFTPPSGCTGVRRCLVVKHGFTPPNGCTWRYTLGLREAG